MTLLYKSYLIVVFWQPMPYCFGQGLHYAETQAEGSGEREHLLTCHKHMYNTFCKEQQSCNIFSTTGNRNCVFFVSAEQMDMATESVSINNRLIKIWETVSLFLSQGCSDSEDKAWPLHVICFYCHRSAPLHGTRQQNTLEQWRVLTVIRDIGIFKIFYIQLQNRRAMFVGNLCNSKTVILISFYF